MYSETLFSDLETEAEALNERSDTVTGTIGDFEERLRGLKLGIETSIILHSGASAQTSLRFARWRGQWCLIVDELDPRTGKTFRGRRLADCGRRVRLVAVSKFDDLLVKLCQEARRLNRAIAETVEAWA